MTARRSPARMRTSLAHSSNVCIRHLEGEVQRGSGVGDTAHGDDPRPGCYERLYRFQRDSPRDLEALRVSDPRDRVPDEFRRWIVQEHPIGSRLEGLVELIQRLDLDLHGPPALL